MFACAAALVLAALGGEGTREVRFRGALVAENRAAAPATTDRAAMERELESLLVGRPDYVPAGIAMSIGGAFSLAGLVAFSILAAVGPGSVAGIMTLVIGFIALPAGLVVVLVAGLVMISVAVDRGVIDQRIRLLRERLNPPPEPMLPAPSVLTAPHGLLLARF